MSHLATIITPFCNNFLAQCVMKFALVVNQTFSHIGYVLLLSLSGIWYKRYLLSGEGGGVKREGWIISNTMLPGQSPKAYML